MTYSTKFNFCALFNTGMLEAVVKDVLGKLIRKNMYSYELGNLLATGCMPATETN
jgi:hypothetical protein